MPGFPLLTDENIDGPIIEGLRLRGWDVQHATEEFGERTNDAPLFEHAARVGRVFVSTDKDMLLLANRWLREERPFRMVWWKQAKTQRILVSSMLDAFEALAEKPDAFAYPVEYLKLAALRR